MFDSRFDKLLIPYLEGSLDSYRRELLEEAISKDPLLAKEVEEMRRLKYRLQRTASGLSNSQSSKSAWPGIEARIQASRQPARRMSPYWTQGLALATCAALAICFAVPFMGRYGHSVTDSTNMSADVSGNQVQSNGNSTMVAANPHSAARPFVVPFPLLDPNIAGMLSTKVNVPKFVSAAVSSAAVAGNLQMADVAPSNKNMFDGLASVAPAIIPSAPEPLAIKVAPTPPSVGASKVSQPAGVDLAQSRSSLAANLTAAPTHSAVTTLGGGSTYASMDPDASEPAVINAPAPTVPTNGLQLATMASPPTTSTSSDEDASLMTQLRAVDNEASTDASNGSQSLALARWQSVLQATSSSSVFGDDSTQLMAMQSLQDIQAAGMLSAMREELEQWQEQDTNDIGVCRMLAALYDLQGEAKLALDQRRKAAALSTAIGEDWFELGQSEEQAGNVNSANVDYNKALQCGDMTNTMHINYARQRLPQSVS